MFKKLKKYIRDTEESLRVSSMSCRTNEDTPQCALIEELRILQHEKYDADIMNLECEMYRILKGIFGDMWCYKTGSCAIFGYSLEKVMSGRGAIPSVIVGKTIDELYKYRDCAEKYESKTHRRIQLEKRIEEIKRELNIR